jgi:hypothetical protein
MCRFTHPMAANRTMSWPCFGVGPPGRSPSSRLLGPTWNHLTAETAEWLE